MFNGLLFAFAHKLCKGRVCLSCSLLSKAMKMVDTEKYLIHEWND